MITVDGSQRARGLLATSASAAVRMDPRDARQIGEELVGPGQHCIAFDPIRRSNLFRVNCETARGEQFRQQVLIEIGRAEILVAFQVVDRVTQLARHQTEADSQAR